jgi:tripartite-type tricarboxylate transporter receptor subunit TctC
MRLMTMPRLVLAGLLLSLTVAAAPAAAQGYPNKPVRMIVAFPAGGPVDALARIFAQRLGGPLGQQVLVENRGGADGVIGAESVARAAPDGYTLFFASSAHAINASLYRTVPYRTVEDFEPVTRIGESPNLIAVTPSLPVKDLAELIALAKSKPGELNYGATSSPTHLATELFTSMAGIKFTRVPYKGAAPAMTALMAGDVQMVLSGVGTMLPPAKAGRLKALAVTGQNRSPLAPEIPTVREAGVPGYVATTWYALLAPAGTPRSIVDRLNAEVRTLLEDPGMKAQLATQGIELTPSTPEELGTFLRSEVAKWAKVVQDTGAKIE